MKKLVLVLLGVAMTCAFSATVLAAPPAPGTGTSPASIKPVTMTNISVQRDAICMAALSLSDDEQKELTLISRFADDPYCCNKAITTAEKRLECLETSDIVTNTLEIAFCAMIYEPSDEMNDCKFRALNKDQWIADACASATDKTAACIAQKIKHLIQGIRTQINNAAGSYEQNKDKAK